MLTDRQKLILKAIVEEYVETAEPVGSKVLTEKPYLGFSSATIRFEMAKLEELGYLEKTHTSSGRIPSELGYRFYCSNLVTRDYDVQESFPLIDEIFEKNEFERDEAIKEALNLLSNLTNYTSVALGPDVNNTLVKKLDFVPLNARQAVILIVTEHGNVQNQMVTIPRGMNLEELRKIVVMLDDCLKNVPLSKVEKILNDQFSKIQIKDFMNYRDQLINSFLTAFSKIADDNYYLSGVTNVFNQPEFNDVRKMKSFIEAMEERSLLKMMDEGNHGLSIKIGRDNQIIPMDNCTVISVPYRIDDDAYGTIAVIGPTRMEYRRVIPLVEYIAKNMSKLYRR